MWKHNFVEAKFGGSKILEKHKKLLPAYGSKILRNGNYGEAEIGKKTDCQPVEAKF